MKKLLTNQQGRVRVIYPIALVLLILLAGGALTALDEAIGSKGTEAATVNKDAPLSQYLTPVKRPLPVFGQTAQRTEKQPDGMSCSLSGAVGPGNTVYCDEPFMFIINMFNSTGDVVAGMSNGFEVYSKAGASWTPITYDSAGGLDNYFNLGVFTGGFGIDGSGADTCYIGGVAMTGGVPNGYDDVVLTVSTQVSCAHDGDTLCIDSAFFPPSGTWLWNLVSIGSHYPQWDGPHCFEIDERPQGPTEITLDHVEGLNPMGRIVAGQDIKFVFAGSNNSGFPINGSSNGFRIYSPDGASWAPAYGDTSGMDADWFPTFYDLGFWIDHHSCTGSGEDTVGFAGAKMMSGTGIPNGWDGTIWWIGTEVFSADSGKHLCVDSAFYPPSGTWLWAHSGGSILPDWDGPHCFEIIPGAPPPVLGKVRHAYSFTPKKDDPVGSMWHELWPTYCRDWQITDWRDNGSGVLDYCDYVEFTEQATGNVSWEHIEEVTQTLELERLSPPQYPIYMDLIDPEELGGEPECYWQGWAAVDPAYYWRAPHPDYGIEMYTQRFTTTQPEELVSAEVYIFDDGSGLCGNDDIYLTVYIDDGSGFPGTQVDQAVIPGGTYPFYPAPTTVNFSTDLIINGEFHIAFSSSGTDGDYECILSDDETTGHLRSSCPYDGTWYTISDLFGVDVDLLISVYLCDPESGYNPVGTYWHEVYPEYCVVHRLEWWEDNGNGYLDSCDYIGMSSEEGSVSYHITDNKPDIISQPVPPWIPDDPPGPGEPPPLPPFQWEFDEVIGNFVPGGQDPTGTEWMELYPNHGEAWDLERWMDNGDGILGHDDTVLFVDPHAKNCFIWKWIWEVTPTLKLANGVDTFYFDYQCGNFMVAPLYSPLYTYWYQVWPNIGYRWRVVDWIDNGNGYVDYCDWLVFEVLNGPNAGDLIELHVESYKTDFITQIIPGPPLDTCDWYKPQYVDFAPQGIPDFDQKQLDWQCPDDSTVWTWCGPAAVANCLWWFDSKFESSPVDPRPFFPITGLNDNYPLVESYAVIWDDHDIMNVQPFIEDLQSYMQTCDYIYHGTHIDSLVSGTRQYIASKGLSWAYRDTLVEGPTYEYIVEQLVECQDVILLFGFYEKIGTDYTRLGGHYTTTAGYCTHSRQLCISDPWFDALEGEPPAGSVHASTIHNNADNISGPHSQIQHDPYHITPIAIPGYPRPVEEVYYYPVGSADIANFLDCNLPADGAYTGLGELITTIEYAYVICPDTLKPFNWEYHYQGIDDPLFDTCVGGDLTVWGTVDCDTSGHDPLFEGYAAKCHTYRGSVPTWANDVLMRFAWHCWCDNVDWIKIAAPAWVGDRWVLQHLRNWASCAEIPISIEIPVIGDPYGIVTNIYYVVDLVVWLAHPNPLRELQEEYLIVDGLCPDLPGYLIGTTPIVFDSAASKSESPFQTTPFTGTLYLDGDLTMTENTSCCIGIRGNVDNDELDEINIADLTYLVAYLFTGGPTPLCLEEADIDGNGEINIGDLTYLVSYLFTGGPPPMPCS
ncbi:MAG: dockerin type I repeat-containing protein [candidate division Zixibacteria bacterium]|nr:dockerin type I repeat-containing protein [candidate division Zixibacteria bacterium]